MSKPAKPSPTSGSPSPTMGQRRRVVSFGKLRPLTAEGHQRICEAARDPKLSGRRNFPTIKDCVGNSVKATMHTAWCDYFATGEGRTLVALVAKARDEKHVREIVCAELGEFWSVHANVAAGVVRNEVTEHLWAAGVFKFLEHSGADTGVVTAKSQLPANFG